MLIVLFMRGVTVCFPETDVLDFSPLCVFSLSNPGLVLLGPDPLGDANPSHTSL